MIYFGIFAACSRYFSVDDQKGYNPQQAFFAGGLAGVSFFFSHAFFSPVQFAGSFFVSVADTIKIHGQVDLGIGATRQRPKVVLQKIYSESGLMGFFRGWSVVL